MTTSFSLPVLVTSNMAMKKLGPTPQGKGIMWDEDDMKQAITTVREKKNL